MIRRPPRFTPLYSSAASDVYKRQTFCGKLIFRGLLGSRCHQAAGVTKRPVSPSGRGLSCGGAGLLGPALITEYILGSPIFRGCYAGKECGTCGGAYGRRAAVIQGACDRMG